MNIWSRRLTIIPGIIGVVVLTLGALITAFGYVGAAGQTYSPANHFVSELGDTQESELATLFNLALVIGGLAYGLHMVGVGLRFAGPMRYVISAGGMAVGIFGALVGVFPMDVNLATHGGVALGFFEGALLLLVVFSLYVGLARQQAYPRWMALLALPMIVSNAVFVYIVLNAGENALAAPQGQRQMFELTTASEWGVIIFLLFWVSVMVIWRMARPD